MAVISSSAQIETTAPDVRETWRRLEPLAILIVALLIVAAMATLAPTIVQRRITEGLINLVAVVGL